MSDDGFSQSQLAEIVARHEKMPANSLCLTPCQTGKFNTTYFVDGGSQPLVLRIAPPDDRSRMLFYEHRMMRQEPDIHAAIQARTNAPIPTIFAIDESHSLIDRDYLLMNRMPGTPISDHTGLSPVAFARTLHEVGRILRQVHDITIGSYGYVGEHQPMAPQRDWVSAFAVMWNKLLDDIAACDGYWEREVEQMRRLLDKHIKRFDRPVPAALLHMDVWAQNILADEDGRLTCLIDWDRALYGDPEIEFAVLDYCGISEPPFWEGYGRSRDTSREAQIRNVFYLLYEIQKYIVIRRVRHNDRTGADRYRHQSLELADRL
jgi:aminoglycoside phosphotransferase (APT) family kinase protein